MGRVSVGMICKIEKNISRKNSMTSVCLIGAFVGQFHLKNDLVTMGEKRTKIQVSIEF